MKKIELTPIELKALKLICRDKSNLELADKLGITLRGTEKVKTRLYTKTRTKSNLGLFKWAVKNDYVEFK